MVSSSSTSRVPRTPSPLRSEDDGQQGEGRSEHESVVDREDEHDDVRDVEDELRDFFPLFSESDDYC